MNLDQLCAEALRRIYKTIDLRIKRALWREGMPSPTRSVGQTYKRKVPRADRSAM